MLCKRTLLILLSFLVFGGARADAALIPLSTHSSEISVDPSLLDADLGFSIVLYKSNEGKDKKEWLLTQSVANLTDPGFSMNQIYFNIDLDPALITKVELKGFDLGDKKNWSLTYDADSIQVAEFGLFDIGLESNKKSIGSLQTGTFTIKIKTTFAASLTDESFVALSVQPGGTGQTLAYGTARFMQGPDYQSAYGAYVPEPATIVLVCLGGLFLRRRRRKV